MNERGESPIIGVVTVTYNCADFLEGFVHSVEQQRAWFRVYCIDNVSTDGTADALRSLDHEQWKVTFNATNNGIAGGNNQGISQAIRDGCEWVLLINNDTSFDETLFEELLKAAELNAWRVIVPKIYFENPVGAIWYAGGGFNRWKGYTGSHARKGVVDTGQFDEVKTVDFAPACAMLVHQSVFREVGLMDEAYFVYFDDTDFCWRLRAAGVPIGYWPQARLVHKVGGSTGGERSPFSAQIIARNRLYFLKKYFGSVRPLLWLPVFVAFYAARYLLKSWKPECFIASVRGTFSYRSVEPIEPKLDAGI